MKKYYYRKNNNDLLIQKLMGLLLLIVSIFTMYLTCEGGFIIPIFIGIYMIITKNVIVML